MHTFSGRREPSARGGSGEGETTQPLSGGGTMLGGMALGLLGGFGLMLAWSRLTRRTARGVRAQQTDLPTSPDAAPRRTSAPAVLESLIDNTAPILEEPPVPHGSMSFHGKSVGERYLVHHGAHPLQGPHFAAVEPQRSAGRRASAGLRPAQPAAAKTGTRLERVDGPVQTAASRPSAAARPRRAAAGVSPLEQALRELMRSGRGGGAE